MDSLLANYASSDEEEDQQSQHPQPSKTNDDDHDDSNFFAFLCHPQTQIFFFLSLPNPSSTFLSLRDPIGSHLNKPKYIFYDGLPFATGLLHYGHILAGTIKDIIFFKSMSKLNTPYHTDHQPSKNNRKSQNSIMQGQKFSGWCKIGPRREVESKKRWFTHIVFVLQVLIRYYRLVFGRLFVVQMRPPPSHQQSPTAPWGLTWHILLNFPHNLILPPHIKFNDFAIFFLWFLLVNFKTTCCNLLLNHRIVV